jgi:hypothetical protein
MQQCNWKNAMLHEWMCLLYSVNLVGILKSYFHYIPLNLLQFSARHMMSNLATALSVVGRIHMVLLWNSAQTLVINVSIHESSRVISSELLLFRMLDVGSQFGIYINILHKDVKKILLWKGIMQSILL